MTEPCDTLGQTGSMMAGQVCENHAGVCVVVTKNIINTACMTYRYANGSGQICDSKQFPITEPTPTPIQTGSCKELDIHGSNIVLADKNSNNQYVGNADFTCYAQSGIAHTIAIDCGN